MTCCLTDSLARFAAGAVTVPESTLCVARLSALDWLAVGRAGVGEPVSRILRDMALDEAGTAQAHLFGTPARVPARMAALVNGTTSHALDYDDTHFAHIGHPSVAVFPAALAIGERQGGSLPQVLEAALVGMELSVRIGLWLGRAHYQAGYHQTATAGAFGAGAAAARLLGLGADGVAQVLGLVATRAAGLKAQFGTMAKPYNAGQAAAVGVEAALLVDAGLQANPGALTGEFGYGASHHGEDAVAVALDGLGEHWLFTDVSHKFHACCHGLHAALEAMRALSVPAPEIAAITVTTHPRWLSVCNQPAPDTGLGAKFSYASALAMAALGHDTARLDTFSDALCADPGVRALGRTVIVVADDSLPETAARLTIRRHDGSMVEADHDLLAPMPLAARAERVRAKAAGLIGAARAEAVWSLLQGGAGAGDLGAQLSG